jgi:hypothetical protein
MRNDDFLKNEITAPSIHTQPESNRRRAGRGQVAVTLEGKRRPELEGEVVHDRRPDNANLPIRGQIAFVEVDDPYRRRGTFEKSLVARSLRGDPLAWMHSHRRIDDAQFLAGRKWQALYDASVLGALRTNHPRNQYVDGGRAPDMLSIGRLDANRGLREIEGVLGKDRLGLVEDVLARGLFPTQIAAARGKDGERAVAAVAREFRESLDILAVHFGLASARGSTMSADAARRLPKAA